MGAASGNPITMGQQLRDMITGKAGAAGGGAPATDANGIVVVPPGTQGQVIDVAPKPPGPQGNLQLQNFNPSGGTGGEGTQTAAIYLDGRQVGEGVFPYLGRSLNGPSQGPGRFDTRRGLGPVDVSVA
jgi:hypothetical protein